MNKLTKWWLNYKELDNDKYRMVNRTCPELGIVEPDNWEYFEQQVRLRIPFGETLTNHQLYIETSATKLIDSLFDKYMDDDTLLITSVVEHEAVENNVVKHNRVEKDHVKLHYVNGIKDFNLQQVKEAIMQKHYKRAFVYVIGTQITTGEVTPQEFYVKIREYLESKGIEVILTIDDVHGMYLVPRDYTIFDYVISTSHALVRRWDMGILWSKTNEDFGKKYVNWVACYLRCLDIVLDRQDKLAQFSYVMKEEFSKQLAGCTYLQYISDSVPHIFSIRVECPAKLAYTREMWQDMADHEVRIETKNYDTDNIFYIRMRGAQYITFPGLLPDAVHMVNSLLDRISILKSTLNEDNYD